MPYTTEGIEPGADLSDEAKTYIVEAARNRSGVLMCVPQGTTGLLVVINGKPFTDPNDPISVAAGRAAINELLRGGYIQAQGSKAYSVIKAGYELADALTGRET